MVGAVPFSSSRDTGFSKPLYFSREVYRMVSETAFTATTK